MTEEATAQGCTAAAEPAVFCELSYEMCMMCETARKQCFKFSKMLVNITPLPRTLPALPPFSG
jgi:hypothetical protein